MKLEKKKKHTEIDSNYEDMDEKELFLRIRDDLLHSRTGIKLDESTLGKGSDLLISEMNAYIDRIYRISEEKKKRFDSYIENFIFGFHVLTDVMERDGISDIKVLSWDRVRIKEHGQRKNTGISFWSPEDYRGFVEMIAVKNGVNIGNVNAIQTFTDKKSSPRFIYRFDVTTATINSTEEPYLHIRKIPKEKYTMEKLVQMGMLTKKIVEYICRRKEEGYLLISGENGSGKTYLLNALLEEIPAEQSVLVAQENEELFCKTHPDMMFQHIAVRRGDKKISFGLKELVVNALLMDIDHLIIGEIKGEEALYFLTAALAGCKGITTIHSMDAAGALDKMADYCKWGMDYSRNEILKMLGCVKTIVYIKDFQVIEIAEHHGWDEVEKRNRLEVVYKKKEGIDRL